MEKREAYLKVYLVDGLDYEMRSELKGLEHDRTTLYINPDGSHMFIAEPHGVYTWSCTRIHEGLMQDEKGSQEKEEDFSRPGNIAYFTEPKPVVSEDLFLRTLAVALNSSHIGAGNPIQFALRPDRPENYRPLHVYDEKVGRWTSSGKQLDPSLDKDIPDPDTKE